MLTNAALFANGQRIRRGINVEWDDNEVRLINRSNHRVFETYEIAELASTGETSMAWDILDARGERVRLVAQQGCGCSGIIKHYTLNEDYSGAITRM